MEPFFLFYQFGKVLIHCQNPKNQFEHLRFCYGLYERSNGAISRPLKIILSTSYRVALMIIITGGHILTSGRYTRVKIFGLGPNKLPKTSYPLCACWLHW
jgi:hypothetical protein